ncbi:MAG: chloride channel protein [Desemzia incerta]
MKHSLFTIKDRRIRYIAKGILVGIFTGIVVSLFRLGVEKILESIVQLYALFRSEPIWLLPWAVVSILAALIIGLLVKSEPNIKGSGIPQVEGQVQGVIHVQWWSILWKKFIGGLIAIGSGLFLGREGPSIQLGAAVGLGTSKLTKGDETEETVLLSSGAGAGLAAAFNAPVAGLMFVLEEVHHNFSPLVAVTTFTSAIVANFVSLTIFGLTPVINIGAVTSLPLQYYIYLPCLGIFLGLAGWLYNKVLLDILPKFYQRFSFIPKHFNSVIPLLLLIPIGYYLPSIIGGGSGFIVQLPKWNLSLFILIALFILRFVFSMVSYGASVPGGIFLPILSLGAILGTIFAQLMIHYFQMDARYLTHFILFAMAGYFTAIGKAPLTAILLVTEMVGGLNQLMPLAVVSLTAYITADFLGSKPIYESLLEKLLPVDHSISINKLYSFIHPIEANSHLAKKAIKDVQWPEDMIISSLHRGNERILPHGETKIYIGDHLIINCDLKKASTIQQILKEKQI